MDSAGPGEAYPPASSFVPAGFAGGSSTMTFAAFKASLAGKKPPRGLSPALQALWLEAKGNWDKAYDCAQAGEGPHGDWVHAYLHRKEGDGANAAYWYKRVRRPASELPLAGEWEEIARALLAR